MERGRGMEREPEACREGERERGRHSLRGRG